MPKYKLEGLDWFPKFQSDLTVKRAHSGLLTVAGAILMIFLLHDELSSFMNSEWESSVGVDTRSLYNHHEHIQIRLDIAFPGMACNREFIIVIIIKSNLFFL